MIFILADYLFFYVIIIIMFPNIVSKCYIFILNSHVHNTDNYLHG